MAITPKRFATSVVGTSAAIITAPNGSARARIDAFSVVNTSAAAVDFSIWLVPPGGSATDAAALVQDRSIAAGSSARVLEAVGHWIESGGNVTMSASAADAVTVTISGVEQTGA